jgi:hypothetical protein
MPQRIALDPVSAALDNEGMENRQGNLEPADAKDDVQIVADCVAVGKPVPADVARRIHDQAELIRQEMLAKHGVLNIGVDIIRELRGELPDS